MDDINAYIHLAKEPFKSQLEDIHVITLQYDLTHRMSYGIPCCYYKGKYLLGYGAFKHHVGLYPGPAAVQALKDVVGPMATSKGTIKLPVGKPVDTDLVREILEIGMQRISN